jgi:flavin reductase (DIM6/NTAB) family NADH-FMN oxidoreductase RutF
MPQSEKNQWQSLMMLGGGVAAGLALGRLMFARGRRVCKTTTAAATLTAEQKRMQYIGSKFLASPEGKTAQAGLAPYAFDWQLMQPPPPPSPSLAFDELDDAADVLHLEPKDMSGGDRYNFLTSAVAPRPIAFVSSVDGDAANHNLAPFSYFNVMAHNPPTLVFSVCRNGDGSKKDTHRNVEASQEFVVNIISEQFVAKANECATPYAYGVSEMEEAGLHAVASHVVAAPRVKEAGVSFECKVKMMHDVIGYDGVTPGATMFVGEIVRIHVAKKALDATAKSVDLEALRPVARSGGVLYSTTNSVFPLPRGARPPAKKE